MNRERELAEALEKVLERNDALAAENATLRKARAATAAAPVKKSAAERLAEHHLRELGVEVPRDTIGLPVPRGVPASSQPSVTGEALINNLLSPEATKKRRAKLNAKGKK